MGAALPLLFVAMASPEDFAHYAFEANPVARVPTSEEGRDMTSEQNKAIVRRTLEEPWEGNLDVIDELVASDYVGHDPAAPEPLRGPEGVDRKSVV